MITLIEHPHTAAELNQILHPLVKQWFFSQFKEFSLPQLYGVMEIHSRKNVLISAPTGATKTLTGFLSILNELVDSAEKGILEEKVYAVYISPLKALNEDIRVNLLRPLQEIEQLAGRKLGLRVAVRTGDTTTTEKAKMVQQPPHILITTPESVAIVLSSIKFAQAFRDVQWVIIDEVHALAENKRGVHLSLNLERLQKLSPAMTRVGLSATIAPLEDIAQFLVGYENGTPRSCGIIHIQFLKPMDLQVMSPVDNLMETGYLLKHRALYQLLHDLIQQHRTTLVFTNTRSATERVVHTLKELFPQSYTTENIAAHHGSLSKSSRHKTEQQLREGTIKTVVCSTSLELGIDIGYIDLVICLGSPKSVARFLQRAGRAGHKLNATVKARMIVMDRDDLVECALLLKSAIEKKIDQVHIPTNAVDVLAQVIYGIVVHEGPVSVSETYQLITNSYCFHDLPQTRFMDIIRYLAGHYVSLEERYVYAKIWYDEATQMIGKKGKMARVLYMTNVGTIPEESYMGVKIGDQVIGEISEPFLERLKPGDVFVLGGNTYQFKYARGMTVQVATADHRQPTVPSWVSEMLPLSFDLAQEINRFRRLLEEQFQMGYAEQDILLFIHQFLYVDDHAARAIYQYFDQQYRFSEISSDEKIVVEHFTVEGQLYTVFHTLFGRRVNDCLSRAVAYVLGKKEHRDVEVGISDNGFYIASDRRLPALGALQFLTAENVLKVLTAAIDRSEVLSRRFRHCATRSLMILRQYKGQRKGVGRQQMGSRILLSAVKRISSEFPILQEARREVLEDLMDYPHTQQLLQQIHQGKIEVKERHTLIPSPFALGLIMQGYSDLIKIEERDEFLRRMHQMILAKISLEEGKRSLVSG